jgi:heptosyltransferase-2
MHTALSDESAPSRPLIVRLRNWVGDVTLGLPTLQRLADAGYALQLLGKGWASDLLAGQGWPVHTLAGTARGRIAQLRELRAQALAVDPGFGRRINSLCFPYSFSSALEFRLAGLRALGHAYEGRSLLLGRAVPRPPGVHELQVYWHLGSQLLGTEAPLPAALGLKPSADHRAQAAALRAVYGIRPGFVVVCPFAGGTWSGQDKTWPDFPEFVAGALPALGRDVLIVPGPGEEATARERYPTATLLPGVGLGAYAALLAEAALMVSNDTGPGHMAAAVGTPLLSVLGPSDPLLWRAWGPAVQVLQGAGTWPALADVAAAAQATLAQGKR